MSNDMIPISGEMITANNYPAEEDFVNHFALHCIVGKVGDFNRYHAGICWVTGNPSEAPYPHVFRGRIMAQIYFEKISAMHMEGKTGLGLIPLRFRVERVECCEDLIKMVRV